LHHAAFTSDLTAEGEGARAVEYKRAVVGDISNNAPARPAIADLEYSRTDGCTAGVGVITSEDRGTGTDLSKSAGAGYDAPERNGVTAIEGQRSVINNITHDRTGCAAVA
jgi:hypothetical protein